MLIRYLVENYKSIHKKQEFSMVPGAYKLHADHIYNNPDNINLLRCTTIYGSNGAGKTNFLKSLGIIRDLVTKGTSTANEKINIVPFRLNKSSKYEPSTFQIDFIVDSISYSYYIEIVDNVIKEESLHIIKINKKDKLVFFRKSTEKNNKIKIGDSFKLSKKDEIRIEIYEEELRKNQPFLFEGSQKELDGFEKPYKWFSKILKLVFPRSIYGALTSKLATDSEFRKKANDLIKFSDTGIHELLAINVSVDSLFSIDEESYKNYIIERVTEGFVETILGDDNIRYSLFYNEKTEKVEAAKIVTSRSIGDDEDVIFEFNEESSGTQRFIDLIPALIETIYEGKVYVIDELNNSLHPILIHELIKEYLSSDNNLSNGQLIFSSHESSLLNLELFRQDEIWFVEKDNNGQSNVYSLSDFKPRYDLDIRKGYCQGKFGAIPMLNPINW